MKRLLVSMAIVAALVGITVAPALAAEVATTTASVSVNEVVSITLTGAINFGNVAPGITEQGTTGQASGTPAITVGVGSETNVAVDIGIKGAIATGTLALDNWKYSKVFDKTGIAGLTTSYVAVYTNAAASSNNAFYHWITVPSGTASGSHTVTVSYKAVRTGTALN